MHKKKESTCKIYNSVILSCIDSTLIFKKLLFRSRFFTASAFQNNCRPTLHKYALCFTEITRSSPFSRSVCLSFFLFVGLGYSRFLIILVPYTLFGELVCATKNNCIKYATV